MIARSRRSNSPIRRFSGSPILRVVSHHASQSISPGGRCGKLSVVNNFDPIHRSNTSYGKFFSAEVTNNELLTTVILTEGSFQSLRNLHRYQKCSFGQTRMWFPMSGHSRLPSHAIRAMLGVYPALGGTLTPLRYD